MGGVLRAWAVAFSAAMRWALVAMRSRRAFSAICSAVVVVAWVEDGEGVVVGEGGLRGDAAAVVVVDDDEGCCCCCGGDGLSFLSEGEVDACVSEDGDGFPRPRSSSASI